MKKLILIAGLVASMGAVADTPVHKVTPEYNSGFCFGMTYLAESNSCFDGKQEARLQSNLERQLSKEQVEAIESLIKTFKVDCTGLGEKYYWNRYGGCLRSAL